MHVTEPSCRRVGRIIFFLHVQVISSLSYNYLLALNSFCSWSLSGDEQYSASTASNRRGNKNTIEPNRQQTWPPSATSHNGQFTCKSVKYLLGVLRHLMLRKKHVLNVLFIVFVRPLQSNPCCSRETLGNRFVTHELRIYFNHILGSYKWTGKARCDWDRAEYEEPGSSWQAQRGPGRVNGYVYQLYNDCLRLKRGKIQTS